MTRRSNPELEQLRAFCLHVLDFAAERTGDDLRFFAQMKDAVSECAQVAGIRMVTSHLVEMLQDLKGTDLRGLDCRLSEAGLPTLSLMRSSENRRTAAILARGKIRNDAEYRLLNARLGDTADTVLKGNERSTAGRLLAEYEDAQGRKPRSG